MYTARRDWVVGSVVVALLWMYWPTALIVRLVYGLHAPEQVHVALVAYGLADFVGSPFMALLLTGSIWVARGAGEPVPKFAVVAAVAAWILSLFPWVAIVVALILQSWR